MQNLELMQKYAANAWRKHLEELEEVVKEYEGLVRKVDDQLEMVNSKRRFPITLFTLVLFSSSKSTMSSFVLSPLSLNENKDQNPFVVLLLLLLSLLLFLLLFVIR